MKVYKIVDGKLMTIDNRPLPNKFTLNVSIKNPKGKLRAQFTTLIELN